MLEGSLSPEGSVFRQENVAKKRPSHSCQKKMGEGCRGMCLPAGAWVRASKQGEEYNGGLCDTDGQPAAQHGPSTWDL